jgi:S1-C subfamily serine protease
MPLDEAGLTPDERVNVAVYEVANRSAVNINTSSVETDRFSFMRERTAKGEGSGTVIDREGHILTNVHVVEGARDIQVTLFDGRSYDASIVGMDPATDLTVLKIDAPADSLYPVTFGNSATLRVGQRVFAIGNPFGLERTLSTGIISSLNRSLPRRGRGGWIKSIIQIDAAINPGNSGGPLLNSRGQMIGMNTAIASSTGESTGVAFAIPVNTIVRVVPELIANGHVLRADIGIPRVYELDQGLLIAALTPGGAAAEAGLQGPKVIRRRAQDGPVIYEYRTVDRSAADLIMAVEGKPVPTFDDLLEVVESKKPGDTVEVTVVRDGQKVEVPVTLAAGD